MIAWIAALGFATTVQETAIVDPWTGEPHLWTVQRDLGEEARRDLPLQDKIKTCPVRQWKYDWHTEAFGETSDGRVKRFDVYAQSEQSRRLDPQIARTLLRFWKMSVERLRIDHSRYYDEGVVDVYLASQAVLSGGQKVGGEHLFTRDDFAPKRLGSAPRVSVIYIYDVESFVEPIEMVREVAHEYGHAILPDVGVYTDPEEWADGQAGERLFLTWLRDELAAGDITTDDTLGATLEDLDGYLAKSVTPLVQEIADQGLDRTVLARRDAAGMRAYASLVTYAQAVLPEHVFRRFMVEAASESAEDWYDALITVVQLWPEIELRAPGGRSEFWVPVGQATVSGGRVLERRAGWAKIAAPGGSITLRNPQT